jgi:hypothetical protein
MHNWSKWIKIADKIPNATIDLIDLKNWTADIA